MRKIETRLTSLREGGTLLIGNLEFGAFLFLIYTHDTAFVNLGQLYLCQVTVIEYVIIIQRVHNSFTQFIFVISFI